MKKIKYGLVCFISMIFAICNVCAVTELVQYNVNFDGKSYIVSVKFDDNDGDGLYQLNEAVLIEKETGESKKIGNPTSDSRSRLELSGTNPISYEKTNWSLEEIQKRKNLPYFINFGGSFVDGAWYDFLYFSTSNIDEFYTDDHKAIVDYLNSLKNRTSLPGVSSGNVSFEDNMPIVNDIPDSNEEKPGGTVTVPDESSNSNSASIITNQEECTAAGGIPTKCGVPAGLADMIHDVYELLKIAVPIVLIIMGMIDLLKGVTSQKEDEIKKGWNTLVKRAIYGLITFFVFTTIQLVISLLPGDNAKLIACVKTFFTGEGDAAFECITTGANTSNNKNNTTGGNTDKGIGENDPNYTPNKTN